jgi:bacillithiol system protein YtxJ
MSWTPLSNLQEWKQILADSHLNHQIVFKHSTRCSISSLAKSRVEKRFMAGDKFHLLDLLNYRPISNAITNDLNIEHESPQVLVIKNGMCIYHASHSAIDYDELMEQIG